MALETKINVRVTWMQFFLYKGENYDYKSLDKIKWQSPGEKYSKYPWSTNFAPDYSATVLAAKIRTNSNYLY